MKKLIIFSIAVMVLLVGAAYLFLRWSMSPVSIIINPGLERRTIMVGSTKLSVEVAATADEQQQGLSDRLSLAPDAGMLFPLVDPSKNGFWMKDMKFPLDFIYFDQGRVVETKENVPNALVPMPFFPNETVDTVLEVNAGWVNGHGIKVGDASDY